ncbi:MAG: Rieske (2Fe-2S) protein [Desulfarculaceae bacterium]|nr:Rieske (2Fe-2S) protein [Desulfarculaceae bacterium]MCF8072296.1 Rieske (2Fe-2S) protein [Desulfarculaceae bacterium]MCF8100217.1 Rieske (2Fe-2S) protein [Desulfarculaceae bacterium]MCF8116210.1 Rieske (2Fe-2S) protein [Desulfarculaceae bacterium]
MSSQTPPTSGPTRRGLIKGLGLAAWACLVGAAGLGLGAVLRLISSGGGPAAPGPVDLGPPGSLAVGQVREQGPVALARDGQGLFALSLVCPHLGCRPAWNKESGRFLCPCHGSSFALDGARLSGPAPRGLAHLALQKGPQGKLIVRPGQDVPPDTRLKA